MLGQFDPNTLALLARTREIELEATSPDGARTHRTIIWVVTVGEHAFVRSEHGTAGRWFQEARHTPNVVVHAKGEAIRATAVLAADPDTVRHVSDAFVAKYGRLAAASTAAMVQPHTLETTLRLEPR
jgi:hypothetical protein